MALIYRPPADAGTPSSRTAAGGAAAEGARIPGIPHPLPPGERVLWHGRPDAAALRRNVFRLPLLAGYLGAMVLVWAVASWGDADFGKKAVLLAGACAVALTYVWWVASLTARHTVYAVTDRRVVMQVGLAFTSMVNIPLRLVESLALADHGDGTGSLALTLPRGERLAYAMLWPHARPWRFQYPEPMLRGIREPARVGAILAEALRATLVGEGAGPVAGSASAPPDGRNGGRAGEAARAGDGSAAGAAVPAFASAVATRDRVAPAAVFRSDRAS